jgi:ParB family transcriptional regulator, chromosome partitioning protein
MAQGERNQRVLAALVLSREVRAVTADRYQEVAAKIVGSKNTGGDDAPLRKSLELAEAFEARHLDTLVKAVAASASYGIDTEGLEALLNYLEVDEGRHFTLDEAYMDLLTVSELESLADEVGLKKAMGERFGKAKAGKRGDFIKALLTVEGFGYVGNVPKAMRYGRRKFKYGDPPGARHDAGRGSHKSASERSQEDAAVAADM